MTEAAKRARLAGAGAIRLELPWVRRTLVAALLVVATGTGLHTTAITPAAAGSERSELPDSVLATVGTRSITVSEFRRTWRETHPGAATDTSTPQSVRQFLEVLIDRELIHHAAAREPWTWTAEDSATYAAKLDRLTLRAALDAAIRSARAAIGDSSASDEALGVLARERALTALAPRFDDAALERLAQAFAAVPRPASDSSLAAQLRMLSALPAIPPADSGAVLARTAQAGDVRVRDVVTPWARLSPAYRPRIETSDQVRDLVANVLFERWLRHDAATRGYDRDPVVARILDRERELVAVQHLMARHIHGAIELEREALERYWRQHAGEWTVPARWRVTRLVSDDRAAATRLALLLRDAAAAESLVVRAARQGVNYRAEILATSDSALFDRASSSGPGAVLGPDEASDGWAVTRVEALLPARTPEFAEVRRQVEDRWYAEASAARLADLLARERRRQRIWIRDAALELGWPGELTEP